jgi:cytochrome c oxidase cbb3-type subunit III
VTAGRVAMVLAAIAGISCEREQRRFETSFSGPSSAPRVGQLVPGPAAPEAPSADPYGANAQGVNQGKTLFEQLNCVGCHAHGGGGMGPPLMDDRWIYGARPDQIFASIAQGRPNGMPAFAGRVVDDQMWQLVAYVRSLGGMAAKDVAAGRSDEMHSTETDAMRDAAPPAGQPAGSP